MDHVNSIPRLLIGELTCLLVAEKHKRINRSQTMVTLDSHGKVRENISL
jgi:hypothetical protein